MWVLGLHVLGVASREFRLDYRLHALREFVLFAACVMADGVRPPLTARRAGTSRVGRDAGNFGTPVTLNRGP